MDSKELRGLMEAYSEVYAPEQLDELSDKKVAKTLKARERRFDRSVDSGAPNKEFHQLRRTERLVASRNKRTGSNIPVDEELDIFDVVLEFLQVEGFAETLEEAEWLMANMIDEEAIDIILGEASSRDEFTRAAIARNSGRKGGITFEPGPNWDPSANRGKGAHLSPKQKEKQRRKALRQEEYVDEAQHARENPEKYEREQAKKSAPVRGERTPMPPRGDKRREEFEKWYAKQMGR